LANRKIFAKIEKNKFGVQMPYLRAFASLFTDFLPFGKKSNPVKGKK
jgi:hypothetical protein